MNLTSGSTSFYYACTVFCHIQLMFHAWVSMESLKVHTFFYFVFVLAFILPNSIMAQEETKRKEARYGFLARFQVGVGSGFLTEEATGSSQTSDYTSGNPISFLSIQLGGSVAPNFAIHAGLSRIFASNVEVVENETRSTSSGHGYEIAALTLGLSYYFASNFYISPEYRLSSSLISYAPNGAGAGQGASTGYGLTVGKEWWTGKYWSTGIALSLYSDSFPSGTKVSNRTIERLDNTSSLHYAAMISATYF